ncbi:MAG: hypothetical protein KTR24_00500 [Saprospiraceae bacterium]|nr:hypothetical protein [Saprospiraceae bacterium]
MKTRYIPLLLLLGSTTLLAQSPNTSIGGSIQIGMDSSEVALPGTIRWTGTDFEGFINGQWISLFFRSKFEREATFKVGIDQPIVMENVTEYTVPDGWNLYLASISPSDRSRLLFTVDGSFFGGFANNLYPYGHTLALGEGMTITSEKPLDFYGYLTPKTLEYFVHQLSASGISAPDDAAILVTTRYGNAGPLLIDRVRMRSVVRIYPGQRLNSVAGDAEIIGCYLR